MHTTPSPSTIAHKAREIQCLICDVDGVLSDGYLYLTEDGKLFKNFHVHDGMGLKLLMHAGIEVAVITGCQSPIVDLRMQQLGIKHYYKGQMSKRTAYQHLKETLTLTDQQFAYIGDDLPDLEVMKQVGLSIAVSNAVSEVRAHADWVTEKSGGQGAVREVCDLILQVHNKTEVALERYLNPG